MTTHAHNTPTPRGHRTRSTAYRNRTLQIDRCLLAPTERPEPKQLTPGRNAVIKPSYTRRARAYLANGDLPPMPLLVRESRAAFLTVGALCVGVALAIGGAL